MPDNRKSDANSKHLVKSAQGKKSMINKLLICGLQLLAVLAICFLTGCKAFTIGS